MQCLNSSCHNRYQFVVNNGSSLCPLTDALVEIEELKKENAKLKKQLEMLIDAQDALNGISNMMHDILHLND